MSNEHHVSFEKGLGSVESNVSNKVSKCNSRYGGGYVRPKQPLKRQLCNVYSLYRRVSCVFPKRHPCNHTHSSSRDSNSIARMRKSQV